MNQLYGREMEKKVQPLDLRMIRHAGIREAIELERYSCAYFTITKSPRNGKYSRLENPMHYMKTLEKNSKEFDKLALRFNKTEQKKADHVK